LSYLDQASFAIPELAISSAQHVMYETLGQIFQLLHHALQEGVLPMQSQLQQLDEIIFQLEQYLEKLPVSEDIKQRQQLIGLLRVMVYIRVLRSDLEQIEQVVKLRTMPFIQQVALDYLNILDSYDQSVQTENRVEAIQNLNTALRDFRQWMSQNRNTLREQIVQYATIHQLSAATSLELLAAQRWLERLVAHSKRLINVLQENAQLK